jgi:hypothetical protein
LLALLRAGAPPTAQGTARKKRRRKAKKPVESPKEAVAPGGGDAQPPCKPGPVLEVIPERKRPKPRLCQSCWQLGYPNCPTCCLAYDSSLEPGPDGVLYRVRLQTEEDRLDWRRREVCGSPFQAPPIGSPNVCPECRGRRI